MGKTADSMSAFKIGHFTDLKRGTGCTVILCPEGTLASAHARGISPGTREFALLSPFRKMDEIHGLLLTGGSAFGLDAAAGVMRFLAENGRGYHTPFGNIPIVPAAVIFDLPVIDSKAYPLAEDAYRACKVAASGMKAQGTVGAGTGATVGKWAGLEHIMKGGLGISRIEFKETWVEAISVVNAVGDIVDQRNNIIAGARKDKRFLAGKDPRIRWTQSTLLLGQHTVLAVLTTNVRLNKFQLHYLSERAHNGIVKATVPAHTSYDGDIVFSLTTNRVESNIDTIAEMGIEAVRESIVNAVVHATPIGQIPSARNV